MPEPSVPKINKWPFFAGDVLLLCSAFFVYAQSRPPMSAIELSLMTGCVALGAVLAIIPFLFEYQALVKVSEAAALGSVVAQIQNLEKVGEQISGATARWQNAQDAADKTANAAKGISEKMAAEVKAFTEFMARMNDGEKQTMRLEIEKLRRGEQDWLQVLVRMLDHVNALYTGGIRSGQPNLIEQLTHFQNACRDAARRVGLAPFAAGISEPFDPERHQIFEGDGKAPAGAVVGDMVATGYTFQGRLLRHALVRLKPASAAPQPPPDQGPTQLPLTATQETPTDRPSPS